MNTDVESKHRIIDSKGDELLIGTDFDCCDDKISVNVILNNAESVAFLQHQCEEAWKAIPEDIKKSAPTDYRIHRPVDVWVGDFEPTLLIELARRVIADFSGVDAAAEKGLE